MNRCHDQLSARPVWLFSSGPVGNPVSKMAQLRIWQLAIHELAIHQIVDNFVGDF